MKPFQASINDADGFKMRAACVCVKSKKEQEVEDHFVVFVAIFVVNFPYLGLVSLLDGRSRLDHSWRQRRTVWSWQSISFCNSRSERRRRSERLFVKMSSCSFHYTLLLQANWVDIWGNLRTRKKDTELEYLSCTWRVSTRRRSGRSLSERGDGSLCRTPRRFSRKINPIMWNTSRRWSRLRRWQSHKRKAWHFHSREIS